MSDKPLKVVFCGLFSYRYRWGLTGFGWAFLVCIIPLASIFLVWKIYPFLAVSKPVNSDVMVVEGWVSAPILKVVAETFQEGNYKVIYTVGSSFDSETSEIEKSIAQTALDHLIRFGVSVDSVKAVSTKPGINQDRTYWSAVELKEWFDSNNIFVDSLNVVTEGPHSRRSRLLFKKAFRDNVIIGVVSIPAFDYDPSGWWRYSEGVKEVISEGAAYFYARFLFSADNPD